MHTAILLAVEAEDAESAVSLVEDWNEHNAPWSDWNEHGGRYKDAIPNGVISYSENPSLFTETVNKFRDFTNTAVKELLHEIGGKSITEIALDPKYQFQSGMGIRDGETDEQKHERFSNGMVLYRAKKLLKLVDRDFEPEQHFYDIEAHDTDSVALEERIGKNPEKQFIVVWDYHY